MQPRTKIFSHRVRDYMRRSPVVVSNEARVGELLEQMASARRTSALIVGSEGRLCGIVTEQDVTRRIALRGDGDDSVSDVMTSPVKTVHEEDYLYFAIARMRRFGWRHMPVVDRAQRPIGLIDLIDALSVAADSVVREIELISQDDTPEGLHQIKAAQVELADSLFGDSVAAPEIQAVISHINWDIHARILDSHLAAMAETGWGSPPVDFALLIMGSGGRGENYLYPDQDNGFILDDYPDEDHTRVDGFFIELAERMTRDLHNVGFPYCRGFVMATNPVWRKTRSQWRQQVDLWRLRRSAVTVQLADIFFDFQGTYGQIWMAEELRGHVTRMTRSSPAFLAELNREISRIEVAVGWFGRFVVEKDKPEHRGKINLKHSGTLPLISSLRLLALQSGITETSTLSRIAALNQKGKLTNDEADYLSGVGMHVVADLPLGHEVGQLLA